MRKYCGVHSGLMWSVASFLKVVNVVSRPVDSLSVFFIGPYHRLPRSDSLW
jgi:hypothetical protein